MEKQYFSQYFRMKILQTVVVFFLTSTIQTSNGEYLLVRSGNCSNVFKFAHFLLNLISFAASVPNSM